MSVQKRPRADILPVRSRASLVNKRFITRHEEKPKPINFKRAIFIYGKLNVNSRLTFSKRRKTKLEENKNNILCGVNTFRQKKVKLREIFVRDHSGQCPVQYLENIGPTTEQPDWLILILGPLN